MSNGIVWLLAALTCCCLITLGQTYEQDELNPSRMARASPLRWGKREAPDSWGIEDEAEKRAPLRWGKRMSDILSELQKRKEQTLLRWGKRAPIRFGKRGPERFGKRGSMQLNAPDWPTDMTEDQI